MKSVFFIDNNFTDTGERIFPVSSKFSRLEEIIVVSEGVSIADGDLIIQPSVEEKIKKIILAIDNIDLSVVLIDDLAVVELKRRGKQAGQLVYKGDDGYYYCYFFAIDRQGRPLARRFFKEKSRENIDKELKLTLSFLKIPESVPMSFESLKKHKARNRFADILSLKKKERKKLMFLKGLEISGQIALVMIILYTAFFLVYNKKLQSDIENIDAEITQIEQRIKTEFKKRVASLMPSQDELFEKMFSQVELLSSGGVNIVNRIDITSKGTEIEFVVYAETQNPLLQKSNLYLIKKGEKTIVVKLPEKIESYSKVLDKGVKEYLK